MSAEDFGGIGFALGVVRGARSFDVDKLGRLTGVTYKQVWRPGENTAECRKSDDPYADAMNRLYYSFEAFNGTPVPTRTVPAIPSQIGRRGKKNVTTVQVNIPTPPTAPPVEPPKPAHDMDNCKCGFYGYYDGSNDYYQEGRVAAVVEGYGETIIGTRGFRASKSRIVALRIPKHVPERLATLIARNYPDIPLFDKFSRMVAEFPPDAGGMEITPEVDPKFWERPA